MNLQILIPFFLYFLVVILIGVFATRFSSRGISEFFLGGRSMGRFVVALSAVVSGRSAWLLLGFTGMAYTMGLSAVWAVAGYTIVEFVLFLLYAPRIRKFSEENDCITLPDFYAARFRDQSGSLRIIIIIIFMIFMVTYVSAQFVGGGKAFFANFGLNQNTGLLITAAIILIYTILGGFLAVSLTDVLQAFIMIIGLIGLPLYGIIKLGGWNDLTNNLLKIDNDFFNSFALTAGMLAGFLGIGLGSPGNPHIIIRYMSIRDPSQFNWTAIVGTVWNILLAAGALFTGLVGRAYFSSPSLLPDADAENVYITLANELLHPVAVGLILASIFAAIMSTADSQLLVAASSIVRDLYEKILLKGKQISQKKLALMSRFVVIILVLIAVILGILIEDLVFWFVLFAWAGLGASIGPTSILALFWERTTKPGIIAGLITGTLTVFVWKIVPALNNLMYELIPAFFISLLITILVSYMSGRKKVIN
ncbi:MAG: proline permease [Bacteroides sp. SM23_62_1]|nr:MAG: proline permease [Bacteroides sp. SM23_62_1]